MSSREAIQKRMRILEKAIVDFEKLRDKNKKNKNRSGVIFYNKVIAERTLEQTTLLKVLQDRI